MTKNKCSHGLGLILVFDHDGENYDDEIAFARAHFATDIIKLAKNVGPGLARQAGLDKCTKDFVMFADADDYFYHNALDSVLERLKNAKFDLLLTAFRYERDNEVKIMQNNAAWLHGKVYRRSFLVKHKIHFNSYRSNEDNGFNRLVLLYKPKVAFEKTITYVYSENPKSITRRNNREYKYYSLEFLAKNYLWAINEYLNNCKECDYEAIALALLSLLLSMYYYYLDYYDVFEVDKILAWSKDALALYRKYSPQLSTSKIDNYLAIYDEEYPNANKRFSFDEFLAKIEAIDD